MAGRKRDFGFGGESGNCLTWSVESPKAEERQLVDSMVPAREQDWAGGG